MTKEKPVQRNKHLVIFSHEHHHGLVFVSRLKKANQTDDKTLKHFVKDFWDKHLSAHLKSEEELLLPFLWDNDITTQFLSDHKQIHHLFEAIIKGEKLIKENAIKLATVLNNHIRFEERTMFPWLENEALTSAELVVIGKKLEAEEISAHHFTPEFWKNENK